MLVGQRRSAERREVTGPTTLSISAMAPIDGTVRGPLLIGAFSFSGTTMLQCKQQVVTADETNLGRRKMAQGLTGAAMMAALPLGVRTSAWAAGSDAPEKTEIKVGFIPLTDCASVVMASVKEFD